MNSVGRLFDEIASYEAKTLGQLHANNLGQKVLIVFRFFECLEARIVDLVNE